MARELFRKKSLDRLSSPEELDQVMRVTGPLTWIGLIGCFILLGLALWWGIYGEIPTLVEGKGILLRKGSIYYVVSPGPGQIKSLNVEVDDLVEKGQVIAELSQPDLAFELQAAKDELARLKEQRSRMEAADQKAAAPQIQAFRAQRRALSESIDFRQKQLEALKKRLAAAKDDRAETLAEYDRQTELLNAERLNLNQILVQESQLTDRLNRETAELDRNIARLEDRIGLLTKKLILKTRITSPRPGRILEIFKNQGQLVRAGEPIVHLEVVKPKKEDLVAFLYFTPHQGKLIKRDMPVRIAPSTVKSEEYGYIIGRIDQVSSLPASHQGMRRVLQNEDLVNSLSAGGAPISVTAALEREAANVSGFRWSSGGGPPLTVESGTLCTASVVISRQAPIRLVLPYLRKNLLGVGGENEQGR